jgi:CBS domain-containing protein
VAQALDPAPPILADLPLPDLLQLVGPTHHPAFPVVENGAVLGVLSVREARRALLDPAVDRAATARAFTRPSAALLSDDDLGTAVQRLAEAGASEAVVLDPSGKPLGVVSREGILEAWRRSTLPKS